MYGSKNKKVLVVATSRQTRGGITSVIKALEKGKQWKKYHCYWVQTHRDGPTWKKIFYFVFGLTDFLVRLPFYDIIHIYTADSSTEKRKTIFSRLTKLFSKRLIVNLHSSGKEFSIAGPYKNRYSYSFRNANKIIALSESWKKNIIQEFPFTKNKIDIIYNPCPTVNPSKFENQKPYILFAGTLTHRKGYDDLIKAFAKIATKYPKWTLKLAGNGEIEEGKNIAKKMGIENQVEFLGWINGDQKDKYFGEASVYCLPSYSEGFPMGVLDAWAYNISVITTPVGGILDFGIDGENALLFPPGNIDKLADCLERLMSDEVLRKHLSIEGGKLAKENFSIELISQKLDKLYSSL